MFLVTTSLGALVLSFFFAYLIYIIIDKPIRNLDRMVLFPTKLSESFLFKNNKSSKNRKKVKIVKKVKVYE